MAKKYLDSNGLGTLWGKIKARFMDDYNKTVSRGEQLITNGTAMLGNNTNFSSWTYDGSMANGSGGSFTKTAGTVTTIYTDDYFPVNPSLPYILEFDMISALNVGYMYSYFSLYDADKHQIGASDHMYVANTLTTLSQELKNGDTVVHLTSNANWDVNTGTATYKRGFIFWNYKNSFGYQYPELTYSRNHWTNLYPDSNVDKTTNTITLSAAWNHGTIPAGTKVSQSNSGASYKYIATSSTKIPTTWTHYTGTMIGVDYSGQNVSGKFPPAVAYARVGFLWNYQGTGNNEQFWLTNLSVKTLTDVSMITGIDTTYLKLTGGTMTGKLTAPYIETGSANDSYFQSCKFRGQGDASTYYHAIDFGYSGNNKVDFHEYGGIWNFYKNTTSAKSTSSLAGSIKYPDGWVGKVNNHTIESDVPADAVFTDTTYESKTAAENGTALSLVTTGEKYLWNNAASGTGSTSWSNISGKPTETEESTTGISIGNHATGTVIGVQSSTTSVTGVQSSTTTASKVTLGTALSIPNVTGANDVTVPIAASSATTVPIKDASATSIPNVTDVGSGSASLTFTMDGTDTKKLIISFSHTHTPPTLGTNISITGVQPSTTSVTGVSGSTTASKVTLGTAISVPNVTNVSDVTVPIKATSATTVPIKNTSASTFVTGATHTITDNGHTHSIS